MLSHFSRVQLFAILWTVAHQTPLSMGILQARILELPRPPPGDLPNPGIEIELGSPALHVDSLLSEPPVFSFFLFFFAC